MDPNVAERDPGPHPDAPSVTLRPLDPPPGQPPEVHLGLEQLLGEDDREGKVIIIGGFGGVLTVDVPDPAGERGHDPFGRLQKLGGHAEGVAHCMAQKRTPGAAGEIRSRHRGAS
jgi:hypothetical protein